MKRPGVALLAAFVLFGAAQIARPDDDVLPLDVQIAVTKMASGVPPGDEEMKRIQEYGLRHRDEPIDGVTFADVIAIMDSARTTGQAPSAAAIAKVRSWGNGMKGRAEQLKKDAAKLKESLGAVGSHTGVDKPDPHIGTITFVVEQTITTDESHPGRVHHAVLRNHYDATFPVFWMVRDSGDELKIDWLIPPKPGTVTGTASLNVEERQQETDSSSSSEGTETLAFQVPSGAGGGMTIGTLAVVKKGRPHFNATIACGKTKTMTVHNHYSNGPDTTTEGTVMAQPMATLSYDTSDPDGPLFPAIPPAYRQTAVDMIPAELKAAAAATSCSFDPAAFRKSWAAGSPFGATFNLNCPMSKTTSEGGGTTTVSTDSRAKITMEFGNNGADLDIVPAKDEATYNAWIPRPFTDTEKLAKAFELPKRARAALIGFTIRFHPKDGPALPKGKIKIKLTDVSVNKGIAINYPQASGQTPKGLYFASGNADDGQPVQPDMAHLTLSDDDQVATTDEVSAVTIYVAAREPGAYGYLEAVCEERRATGLWKPDGKPNVAIPHDDNKNHIADQWETDHNILAKSYRAEWDEEEKPSGPSKGDGLTLYDEYRGIIVEDPTVPHSDDPDLKHIRLDPTVKKLIVVADDTTLYDSAYDWYSMVSAGAKLFGKETGLGIVLARGAKSVFVADRRSPAQININSAAPPAYAVRVVQSGPIVCNTNNPTVTGDNWSVFLDEQQAASDVSQAPTSPKEVVAVRVYPEGLHAMINGWLTKVDYHDDYWLEWFYVNGIKPDNFVKAAADAKVDLYPALMKFTIFHELGHSVGALHHDVSQAPGHDSSTDKSPAERRCSMYYWADNPSWVYAFVTGAITLNQALVPTEPADGPPVTKEERALPPHHALKWKPFSLVDWAICPDHKDRFPRLKPK